MGKGRICSLYIVKQQDSSRGHALLINQLSENGPWCDQLNQVQTALQTAPHDLADYTGSGEGVLCKSKYNMWIQLSALWSNTPVLMNGGEIWLSPRQFWIQGENTLFLEASCRRLDIKDRLGAGGIDSTPALAPMNELVDC